VSLKERTGQEELLGEAQALLADRGVEAQVIAGAGDPVTEILAAASELDTQTIVVGRRAGTAPHLVRGSLSSKLVRRFDRDVLVVH
jgi:nucleotide-binding universal stress UspA family protein